MPDDTADFTQPSTPQPKPDPAEKLIEAPPQNYDGQPPPELPTPPGQETPPG